MKKAKRYFVSVTLDGKPRVYAFISEHKRREFIRGISALKSAVSSNMTWTISR